MNDRLAQALTRLFDRHRIVFWYDAKQELHGDFEALHILCVEEYTRPGCGGRIIECSRGGAENE